jgi:PhnB protein
LTPVSKRGEVSPFLLEPGDHHMPKKPAAKKMKKIAPKSVRRTIAKGRKSTKARSRVSPIPKGLHSLTPHLTLKNCAKAIEFYKRAFGAKVVGQPALAPDGRSIWHAHLTIGDSVLFMNDYIEGMAGPYREPTASLWIYGADVDGRWKKALQAGGKVAMPLDDQFWGDRMGVVTDEWGVQWNLCEHKKDLTPAQMKSAGDAFAASQAQGEPRRAIG